MVNSRFEEYRKKLEKLNLKTRDDLRNLVIPLVKKANKITVKNCSLSPANSQLTSHIGGQPYFEKGEKWPKTKKGRKLEFVFQIFNGNNIELPKSIKLIQFFYDMQDSLATKTEDDGWLVKVYENLNYENIEFIKNQKSMSIYNIMQ